MLTQVQSRQEVRWPQISAPDVPATYFSPQHISCPTNFQAEQTAPILRIQSGTLPQHILLGYRMPTGMERRMWAHLPAPRDSSEKPLWPAPSCSSTMGTSNIIDPDRQADRRWGAARGWRLGAQLRTNPSSPSLKGLCPEAGRGVWGERELCAACAHSVPQPHRGQG